MATGSKGLLRNTAVYAAGTFGSKVLAFLIVPLYSYYLNKEEFGYFDVVLSAINLAVPFFTLQLSDGVFRWLIVSKGDVSVENRAISNAFFFLFASIVLVSIVSVGWYFIQPLKGHFLILLMTIGAMVYPFIQQIARGLGYSKMFALNGVIYTVIYLIGNLVLLVWLKLGVEALLLSNIIAYFLASLFLLLRLRLQRRLRLELCSFDFIREVIQYSLPLIPNTISWWLINSANKFIVLTFLGVSSNGLFAMAGRFPVILVMVNQVFTLAWQERAITDSNRDGSEVRESNTYILSNLLKVQLSLVFFLSLLSKNFVELFLAKIYIDSWYYMPVMFLGVAFLSISSFYGAFYLGNKKTKELFKTTLYGGLINICIALVLVKTIGLMGVVIGTALGFLFLTIVRAIYANNQGYVRFPTATFIKYSILSLLSFVVAYFYNSLVFILGAVLLGLILIILDNYKELKNLKKKILR